MTVFNAVFINIHIDFTIMLKTIFVFRARTELGKKVMAVITQTVTKVNLFISFRLLT